MSQIHNIVAALIKVTGDIPALADLLPGGLHQGTDANRKAPRPFGLLTAERLGVVEEQSGGVKLVEYRATLQVVHSEVVGGLGDIMETFDRYFGAMRSLPGLPENDKLVGFFETEDDAAGEDEKQDTGKDIINGAISWSFNLSEHQPALEV